METVRVGGRRYSDPDVISLIRATGELIDPRSAVLSQARQLNEEYRSYEGRPSDPFKRLKIIASLRGLTISRMSVGQRSSEVRDAALIPGGANRGVTGQIFYNPLRPPGRVAFSIAHEIAHTFFPNTTTGARFRDITAPDSREANELERLCDLAASELLMPSEEFTSEVAGSYRLEAVNLLADIFGSSFEATVFRLATAHPGFAAAGLLKYRLRKDEGRKLRKSDQSRLFENAGDAQVSMPTPKYRRQSFFASSACGEEYVIRWNKSFAADSCIYIAASSNAVCTAVERLPNLIGAHGVLEAIRAPFQRDDADSEFPDILFFWSAA
jgi:Zn-dependent peptidase ImmA (M78 family)